MYRAFALLPPAASFSIPQFARVLGERFPGFEVAASGDRITISQGDWSIDAWLNASADVAAESAALAEKIAGVEDGSEIEACTRRVEVWSESPDPFVEHLSDFHTVVEALKSFPGAILVDPNEPALM